MMQLPNGFAQVSLDDLKALPKLPQPYAVHTGMQMHGFLMVPTKAGSVNLPINYTVLSQVPGGVITFTPNDGIEHTVGWLPGKGKVNEKVGRQVVGYNGLGMYLIKETDGSIMMSKEPIEEPKPLTPEAIGDTPPPAESYLPTTPATETVGEAMAPQPFMEGEAPNSYLPPTPQFNSGGEVALRAKMDLLRDEGYDAPGQPYAIAKSMGYNDGGDVEPVGMGVSFPPSNFPKKGAFSKKERDKAVNKIANNAVKKNFRISLTTRGIEIFTVMNAKEMPLDLVKYLAGEGAAFKKGGKVQINVGKNLFNLLGATATPHLRLTYEGKDGNLYTIAWENNSPVIYGFPNDAVVGVSKNGYLVVELDGETVETNVLRTARPEFKPSFPLSTPELYRLLTFPPIAKQYVILQEGILGRKLSYGATQIAKTRLKDIESKMTKAEIKEADDTLRKNLRQRYLKYGDDYNQGALNALAKKARDLLSSYDEEEAYLQDLKDEEEYKNLTVIPNNEIDVPRG